MALQDLIDKDAAAKTLYGKSGELPCKYPEPSVDLTGHTPAYECVQAGGQWRLTQAGAKAVHADLKAP